MNNSFFSKSQSPVCRFQYTPIFPVSVKSTRFASDFTYMKYSQLFGFIAAMLMIGCCFLPWAFISSRQLTITGWDATGTSFGKPGLFSIVLCVVMAVFFAIPAIWAKRSNVFLGALNLAWAFRNFLLVSTCMMGECPEKKPALYAILVLAGILQAMALFPKMQVSTPK